MSVTKTFPLRVYQKIYHSCLTVQHVMKVVLNFFFFNLNFLCHVNQNALNSNLFNRDIELLALFVACLCHDIDHRGTTNSFQVSSVGIRQNQCKLNAFGLFPFTFLFCSSVLYEQGSTLAALYSSKGSVLEVCHVKHSYSNP